MNRKTLTAFAVFAALILIAVVALRRPEKGQRSGQRPRPVAVMKASDVDTLEVTKAKVTTVLKKDGGKYRVTAPVTYAADEQVAKGAFDALEKLDFSGIVSDQKAKHAEYEVPDDGLRVVAKKGATVLADLIVGKSTGSGTMVRPTGKDQVWQAAGAVRWAFDKDTTAWRDKTVTSVSQNDVDRIEVLSKAGGKIIVEREPKKDGGAAESDWRIVEAPMKIETIDQGIPNGIASALASLRANEFADATKAEETGLGDPSYTVTVSAKGEKKATLLVGAKKGEDDYYVKSGEAPQVYLVKKYAVERAMKRPIEFRDKTVCNLDQADITEVQIAAGADSFDVSKKGSDWKGTKPAMEVDTAKITPVLSGFKDWKATSFAEDTSTATTGLAKPKATINVKAPAKHVTCSVKIGAETKDKQSYHAQVAGSNDVYLVAKWNVDRILVKPDTLKKSK